MPSRTMAGFLSALERQEMALGDGDLILVGKGCIPMP
jgi:hypothetical protein